MFGKIMSISDDLMYKYFELLTQADLDAIKAMHPKEAKYTLAEGIVEKYHGAEKTASARKEFDKVFVNKELPDDIGVYTMHEEMKLSNILVKSGMVPSKNEARRLIVQKSVSVDSQKVDRDFNVNCSCTLQVGKRKFKRIKLDLMR